jgi:hypothetical protein
VRARVDPVGAGRLMEVRKLAALDLVFHGPRFVLVEFTGALLVGAGLGVLSLRAGLPGGHLVAWQLALGLYLVGVGLNYVPLALHAAALIRTGDARQAVAVELKDERRARRVYGTQEALLLVPLAVAAPAAAQALRRR